MSHDLPEHPQRDTRAEGLFDDRYDVVTYLGLSVTWTIGLGPTGAAQQFVRLDIAGDRVEHPSAAYGGEGLTIDLDPVDAVRLAADLAQRAAEILG